MKEAFLSQHIARICKAIIKTMVSPLLHVENHYGTRAWEGEYEFEYHALALALLALALLTLTLILILFTHSLNPGLAISPHEKGQAEPCS